MNWLLALVGGDTTTAKQQKTGDDFLANQSAAARKCVEYAEADGGETKTYLCSSCKKRFHMACQKQDPHAWKNNPNTRNRLCGKCRKKR